MASTSGGPGDVRASKRRRSCSCSASFSPERAVSVGPSTTFSRHSATAPDRRAASPLASEDPETRRIALAESASFHPSPASFPPAERLCRTDFSPSRYANVVGARPSPQDADPFVRSAPPWVSRPDPFRPPLSRSRGRRRTPLDGGGGSALVPKTMRTRREKRPFKGRTDLAVHPRVVLVRCFGAGFPTCRYPAKRAAAGQPLCKQGHLFRRPLLILKGRASFSWGSESASRLDRRLRRRALALASPAERNRRPRDVRSGFSESPKRRSATAAAREACATLPAF